MADGSAMTSPKGRDAKGDHSHEDRLQAVADESRATVLTDNLRGLDPEKRQHVSKAGMSLAVKHWLAPSQWLGHLREFSRTAPLGAAVLAPFSILLDIPSVTEKWYTLDGTSQPDPTASLILSGFGLGLSVIANALLIIRFSLEDEAWRMATYVSVIFWVCKTILSTVNLIVFGALTRDGPGFAYDEGFWCAVVSDITSGLIVIFLLFHFVFEFLSKKDQGHLTQNVRIAGRHFMLQTTAFLAWVGLSALIFSRLEDWTYLQGIYFTIVSFTTIGFGDFLATKTASRILLFPMCLFGIALLGSLVQMIVTFFSDRAADRKAETRSDFERQRQMEENEKQNPADLAREIVFLEKMNENQDMWDQFQEFSFSCLGFLVFWIIGALLFSRIEGWTYPTGLYFCYVFFLSMGYGDYEPVEPAGRVVFIVYALLAVPVMASFAVQAVTQVITRLSLWRLKERQAATGVDETRHELQHPPPSHAEFVERFSRKWEHSLGKDIKDQERQDLLMHEVLKQAIELESHARRLLINHLPNGSKAQVVLKADRNVQLRDVRKIRRQFEGEPDEQVVDESEGGRTGDRFGGPDAVSKPLSEEETLDEVQMYRESFASFLAAGSRMKGLTGRERFLMERREEFKVGSEGREKDHSAQRAKEEHEDTL